MRTSTQKRAVIYLRTSSAGQVEKEGPKVQEDVCRAYATGQGMAVVAVLHDAGVTGTSETRPMLAEAIAMVEDGEADAIVFPSADRLARDMGVGALLMAHMWRAGAEVHNAAPGTGLQDPEDPYSSLMRGMLLVIAQFDRDMTVQRLRRAREKKAAEGGKSCGQYLFGENKDPLMAERERNVLACIRNLHGQGVTAQHIARYLNNLGYEWTTRNRKEWSRQNVQAVIRRLDTERE